MHKRRCQLLKFLEQIMRRVNLIARILSEKDFFALIESDDGCTFLMQKIIY